MKYPISCFYQIENYALHQMIKRGEFESYKEHIHKKLSYKLGEEIGSHIALKMNDDRDHRIITLEFDPTKNYRLALDEVLKDHSDVYVENLKKRYNLE